MLQAFFTYLLKEEMIQASPMDAIAKPKVPQDQVPALSSEQVVSDISAAKKSNAPARDEAIIKLLYDTGIRAEELCNLRV